MNSRISDIESRIIEIEQRLGTLDAERAQLTQELNELRDQVAREKERVCSIPSFPDAPITNISPADEKIALVRRLFRGRNDVYARRWESPKTGKSGYQPACRNEWVNGLCDKRRVKCADCPNREFLPLTDAVVRNHVAGHERNSSDISHSYVIGIYPMLSDETCWFLAADFDKASWQEDALAFMDTCAIHNVPAGLERSRSGNGGHVWIFFAESVSASLARQLGAFLITDAMRRRPEIGFDSYDRFFPNQDTLPKGGFGNLIALPFQGVVRKQGNTLFLDEHFVPYPDQWTFLSSLQPMGKSHLMDIVEQAQRNGQITGVRMVVTDEYDDEPWAASPSHKLSDIPIQGPLPKSVKLVLGNQVYVEKAELPDELRNRLIRLAAFQNPEFYKAQAMRLPTFGKPRIISCAEDFSKHIALPRGFLDEIVDLLRCQGVGVKLQDERYPGTPFDVEFQGELTLEQTNAASALLSQDTGVLAASTAFGKTVVAINVVAQRGVNTLILVHRQQLLDQWVARLSTFLDIDPKQIGRIGGGKHKPTGIIDVALLQSLCRKGVVDDIVANYGHLVVDECHHISASSFEQVARACKAKYVLGLSATPARKDGHHPIIFMQCGPIRYRDNARDQAALRPFEHRLIVRRTDFRLPLELSIQEKPPIQDIYSAIVADTHRNNMIIDDVISAVEHGRSPVVITERKEHLEFIAAELSKAVKNVIILKGGMGARQRKAVADELAAIPDTEERVIVVTGRYLGEGFDDARLDTLFLTMPISWKGTLAQYAGRLHRLHAAKNEVRIYDYADLNVPMLVRMHESDSEDTERLATFSLK
jgi:superfamily II DNA or RNA helicase